MKFIFALIFAIVLIPNLGNAQLKMAKIFSDNMVLQRDQPMVIWGSDLPGTTITAIKGKEKIQVKTKRDSTWQIQFKPEKANKNPQTIILKDALSTVTLKNILIGDIWVCIGQSNMEFPLFKELHYNEEKQNAYHFLLRWYNPTYAGKNVFNLAFSDSIRSKLTPSLFYTGTWEQSDSASIQWMSAVAYYFGKEISSKIDIPIGLIQLSIGGAPLETFISTQALGGSTIFSNKLSGNWVLNKNLPNWVKERGIQNMGNTMHIPNDAMGNNHPFKPGFAFESGIRPILKMPIKGILCYQGESNAQELDRVYEYQQLNALMINDYRKKWNAPNLPYYYAQLSSIDTLSYKSQLWPQFRNEQRIMESVIPNIAMVVTSDVGAKNDVHPTNKKIVGHRFALVALKHTYSKKLFSSGPLPIDAIFKHDRIIIHFKNTANRLQIFKDTVLHGFSIDGINEVVANIKDNHVILRSKNKPSFVYYAWQPFSQGNLINKDSLPASTFKIPVK